MAFAIMGMTLDMIGLSVVVTSACDLELTQAQQSIVMSMPFLGNYYAQIIFLREENKFTLEYWPLVLMMQM